MDENWEEGDEKLQYNTNVSPMHSWTLLAKENLQPGSCGTHREVAGRPPGVKVTIPILGRKEGVWPSSNWRVVEPPLTKMVGVQTDIEEEAVRPSP